MAVLQMHVRNITVGGTVPLLGFTLPPHRWHYERFVMAPESSPQWAKQSEPLWSNVERADRRAGAVLAREVVVRLPSEVYDQDRSRIVRKFVSENFVQKGFAAEISIQGPARENQAYHARILVAARPFQGESLAAGRGLLITAGTVQKWRSAWEQVLNGELAAKGLEPARIPLSKAEQVKREVKRDFEFLYKHLGAYPEMGKNFVSADPQNKNYRMIGLIAENHGLPHNVELPLHELQMAKHLPKEQLQDLVMNPAKVQNLSMQL